MTLLTVPNWSFGRSRVLLQEFAQVLAMKDVRIHYLQGDVDHNRTVSAFSGDPVSVVAGLLHLAEVAFEAIDLSRHVGVHPRIGALDVCPFVIQEGSLEEARFLVEAFGKELAEMFEVPVYLYEKSERGRHEADLPALRRGGFGGLLDRELRPDFGPSRAHPRLGVSVVGIRDPLIAMNVDLGRPEPDFAKGLAREVRDLRLSGDPRFLGVRALGFPLASREASQVSMNLTLPDLTPVDPIVDWVIERSVQEGVPLAGTELIGVIRERDVPTATRLPIRAEQIVA